MKKVLVTGSKGIVGNVLVGGLRNSYLISAADLPEFDIRSYSVVLELSRGQDAIIHLAWNTKTENGNATEVDLDNTKMYDNVYRAALENEVPRVIMASSVHATNYEFSSEQGLVSVEDESISSKVYGRHKRQLEKDGEKFALKGLEVICIRLGGVCGDGEKPWDGLRKDGLAYPDLITLFGACLDACMVPNNYSLIYGVSKNRDGVFDLSNPFGWKPEFDAGEFYDLDK